MAKRGFTLDDALWQQKIRKMAQSLKVDEKEFVKQQGGLFLRDLAKFAPPYDKFPTPRGTKMGTAKGKKAGELAILYDLRKLFFVPDDKGAYIRARDRFPGVVYGKGGKIIGVGVARSLNDMAAHHRRNTSQMTGRAYNLKGAQQMWVNQPLFNKYYKLRKAEVGKAKAAIATAAVKVDPARMKDVPKWVAIHMGRGVGRMIKMRSSWNALFDVRAYGLQHIQQKTLNILKRGRLKAMESRLKFILRANAKKAGFKVR